MQRNTQSEPSPLRSCLAGGGAEEGAGEGNGRTPCRRPGHSQAREPNCTEGRASLSRFV